MLVHCYHGLEFTPLEFETAANLGECNTRIELEFTPLEFETASLLRSYPEYPSIRIYSVGV